MAEHLLQHQVAGGEGIRLAEAPQGDVLRGPRADAGQCHAAGDELFQRLARPEIELAAGAGGCECSHAPRVRGTGDRSPMACPAGVRRRHPPAGARTWWLRRR
ncbi:hypothetical protein G6F59_017961 [Rhizopus arrhizus]|nr:hypothetical protein G6F59_017961 [Rhizopus arrhizus]